MLPKKSSAYLLVLTAATGAVLLSLRWFEAKVGMGGFFSGVVISDAKKFGPIGIIFALLSYLIAIGVVVILGAVVGIVWQERGLSFAAVLRKLRRAW